MIPVLEDVEQANGYYQEGWYDAAIQHDLLNPSVVIILVFFFW